MKTRNPVDWARLLLIFLLVPAVAPSPAKGAKRKFLCYFKFLLVFFIIIHKLLTVFF
ncbi:hypothetical protein Peur_041062 [Populus x canadensis]